MHGGPKVGAMPEFLVACTPVGDCLVALAFVDRVSCVNGAEGHYANLGNFRDADGPPRGINDHAAFTDDGQRLVV